MSARVFRNNDMCYQIWWKIDLYKNIEKYRFGVEFWTSDVLLMLDLCMMSNILLIWYLNAIDTTNCKFVTLFVTQIAGETNTEVAIAGKQTVTTVQAVS